MKVLLADDNPLILERFSRMVDWKKQGFETLLTAVDGKMALQKFEKNKPELVITDIQMPKMTGIELAEQIKKEYPETVFYFLTSYEEFSYVKSALELGSCGYLLKHETTKEKLEKILEEAKKEIRKRTLHTRYTAEAALFKLIQSEEEGKMASGTEDCELSLPDRYDMFWLIQDHIYPVMEELLHVKGERISAKEVAASCYRVLPELAAVLSCDSWSFLCLLKSGRPVAENVYELKRKLAEQYGTTFSVLIIATDAPIGVCAEKYSRSRDARKQKIFNPQSFVVHMEYAGHSRRIKTPLDEKKADGWLKERQMERLGAWVDENYMQALEARDWERFEQLTRYLGTRLLEYSDKVVNFQKGEALLSLGPEDLNSWYDAGSIYQWMRRKLSELARVLERQQVHQYSEIVNRAIGYVHRNYTNCELSVEMIAEKLKISANYLNTVVKKETGETLWRIVIKVRMERARELLSMGNDRMAEVCRMSGYSSMSYFSKVFKETYGMSPLEYRRSKQ